MNLFRIIVSLATVLLFARTSVAQVWTQTTAPNRTWVGIASSADQSKLIAVTGIDSPTKAFYRSTNSGLTWTPVLFVNAACVASSADGDRLAALSDSNKSIFTSTNGGSTWSQKSPAQFSGNWVAIASSASGSNLVGVTDSAGSAIYTSANAGAIWISNNVPPVGGYSVASSADGATLVAALKDNHIYISTNSGTTWKTNIALSGTWITVACSTDGSKLAAAAFGGQIYTSTNSGAALKTSSVPVANWNAIASSADGNKMVAAIQGGQIYSSINGGTTWKTNDAPNKSWTSLCSSADGDQFFAVDFNNGGIWSMRSISNPKLNIAVSGAQAMVSWLIPSTNFVLQQSGDLVSWTNLTNSPIFNLTNLQNETTLPLSGNGSFFRLQTP